MSIDRFFAAIEAAGIAAAVEAMTRGAQTVAASAKGKAPVRKVFQGQDTFYRIRLKSIADIERDRGLRQALGLGPELTHIYPPSVVTKRAPQMLAQRDVTKGIPPRMRLRSAQERLDRRGRYELRSGRAIHKGQLGGRLRDEIFSVAARVEGHIIVSRVVSPTPYAKYQEMGTRHNPAHPYLRPAGHESTGVIRADIGHSVASAAQEAVGSVRIKVKYKLKVGAR